jgi:hypothetical protein
MMEGKLSKITVIIYSIIASYLTIHFLFGEVYFQRYESIFVAYIEMYLNNIISISFPMAPLASTQMFIDYSLPDRVQGIIRTEAFYPNFISYFLIIHYITGLSPQLLVVLPLGLIFIPIIYFNLICILIKLENDYSSLFRWILIIYMILFFATTKLYGSFYVAPTAYALFLILLTIIIKIAMDSPYISKYTFIIVICTFSLSQFWHSLLLTFLIFIFSIVFLSCLFMVINKKFDCKLYFSNDIFKKTTSVFIIVLIISITFAHLWQSSYLHDFFGEASILDFLNNARIKLFGGVPFSGPFSYNYKNTFLGMMLFNSMLMIYVISSMIFIIPFIYIILFNNDREIKLNPIIIIALSIFMTQIIDTILYYKSASLSFPLVPEFFPLLGIAFFQSIVPHTSRLFSFFKKILLGMLFILIILTIINIIALNLTHEAGSTPLTKYNDLKDSFNWSYSKMNKDAKLFLDFNILGKYLQLEALQGKLTLDYVDLGPDEYSILVGETRGMISSIKNNYVVIDKETMIHGLPIHSSKARALLKPEWNKINSSKNQNKIFEDYHIAVFIGI